MDHIYRMIPTPPQFFQEAEQVPFSRCSVCDCEFDDYTPYVIEKAFQSYQPYKSRDLVFEYAMCMRCYEELSESLSEESREAMSRYLESRIDFESRADRLLGDESTAVDAWLSECVVSGKSVEELDGYQIAGVFIGSHMLLTHAPMLISAEVVGEIAELLSKKTLDVLGGFARDVMPQPPGLARELPTPALVV